MLIAEDLLLLLTDDQTGRLAVSSNEVAVALGGALLVELTLAHRVDVAGEAEAVREGRLVVRDASTTSDDLLDEALAQLVNKQGKKPKEVVVPALGKGVRDRLHARLVDRGLLREESRRILGVFPTHRWPANDAAHEDSVRAFLVDALRVGATDDQRVAALVSLLYALKAVEKVVDPDGVGVTKKEMKANAKRIAEGNWVSEAVRKTIDETMAAVIAATSSATVVSGSP